MADNGWVGAATDTLNMISNNVAAAARNKKQFKYQQQAMDKQLAQNKELWDYQNAYNTPQAQMERFKAAGLNPHLIYGGGSANAGNASPVESPEQPTREAFAPEFSGNPMLTRLQIRQMDQQYAATNQAMAIAQQKSALTAIETSLKNLAFMREKAREGNFKSLAQSEQQTQKFIALRSKQLFYNEQNKGNLMDQLQTMREKQMTQMDLDASFKQHRNDLAKLGIYQSDDVKWRVLLKASQRMGIDIGELLAQGAAKLKYLFE